jgi:hypothetical protein
MAAEYVTKTQFRNTWMAGPDGIYYLVLSECMGGPPKQQNT